MNRALVVSAAALAAVALAGACGGDDAGPTDTTVSTVPVADVRMSAEDATVDYGDLLAGEPAFDAAERAQRFADGVLAREESGGGGEGLVVRVVAVSAGAVALVEVRGIADDAIAGYDLTLVVVQESDAWRIASVVQQTLCARGVTEEDLCV